MCLVLCLQKQIPIPGDIRDAVEDTEMPSTEPEAEQAGEEQTMEEPKTSGEQTIGKLETRGEPEVYTTLVPSGVVTVAPLHVDDSPLGTRHDVLGGLWHCGLSLG